MFSKQTSFNLRQDVERFEDISTLKRARRGPIKKKKILLQGQLWKYYCLNPAIVHQIMNLKDYKKYIQEHFVNKSSVYLSFKWVS